MAEILPRHYIIGIIMFTFVILGGIALLNDFKNDGAAFVDSEEFAEFNDTFNTMDDVDSYVGDLEDSIVDTEVDTSTYGMLDNLISGAWNTLKLLFSSLSFMDNVFKGLSSFFGVPSWVVSLILLLIVVIIAFAIFTAIFQREI